MVKLAVLEVVPVAEVFVVLVDLAELEMLAVVVELAVLGVVLAVEVLVVLVKPAKLKVLVVLAELGSLQGLTPMA